MGLHCDETSPLDGTGTNSEALSLSWCGFCLRQYTETPKKSERSRHHDYDKHRTLPLFFKLLGRYVSSQSNAKNSSFLKSSANNDQLVDILIGFGSCQDCSYLLEDFCYFYNEIKILEMKMNGRLEMLCAIIKSAEKVSSRVKILEEILSKENKSFRDLQLERKKILTKVSVKLKAALPKVTIKRRRTWSKLEANKHESPTEQVEKTENLEDLKLEILEPFIPKPESVEESVSDLCDETENLEECPEIKTDTVPRTNIEDVPKLPLPEPSIEFESSNVEKNNADSRDMFENDGSRSADCSTGNNSNGPREFKVNDKVSTFDTPESNGGELEKADPPNYFELQSQSLAENVDPGEKMDKLSCISAEIVQNETTNQLNLETVYAETIEDEVVLKDSRSVSDEGCNVKNVTALESSSTDCNLVTNELFEETATEMSLRRSKRKFVFKNEIKEEPTDDNNDDNEDRGGKFLKVKAHVKPTSALCRCPKCKKLMRSHLLQSHLKIHTGKDNHWFDDIPLSPEAQQLFLSSVKKCKVRKCKKEFFTDSELEAHKKLHGKFKCSFCSLVFDYAPKLMFHEMTHVPKTESDSEKLLPCPRCPYSTKTRKFLCTHFIETHLEMPLDYQRCPICGNQLYCTTQRFFRSSFRKHLQKSHDYTKKIYRCKENGCKAYFNLKVQLGYHQYEHFTRRIGVGADKGKVIECKKCGKRFAKKSIAMNHYKRLHLKEEVMSVAVDNPEEDESCVCHHCGKTLKSQKGLLTHIRRVHSNNPPVEVKPKKTYICETCGKHCRDICLLKLHVLTHTGPESWPFECSVCGKRCISQGKLDEHMRTHSNEKPYSCEYCGVRYAHRHNLRIHINNKHGDIAIDKPRKFDKSCLASRKRSNPKNTNSANGASSKARKPTKRRKQTRHLLSDSDSNLSD